MNTIVYRAIRSIISSPRLPYIYSVTLSHFENFSSSPRKLCQKSKSKSRIFRPLSLFVQTFDSSAELPANFVRPIYPIARQKTIRRYTLWKDTKRSQYHVRSSLNVQDDCYTLPKEAPTKLTYIVHWYYEASKGKFKFYIFTLQAPLPYICTS